MNTKFLVICVDENLDILSVNSFDNEEDANAFLAKDASATYEEMEGDGDSSIEVRPGFAEVTCGEAIYRWTIYPMAFSASLDAF